MFKWNTTSTCTIKLVKVGITNCYLISYENTNILVDTGQKRFSKSLYSFLKSNFSNQIKLDFLLLTHTHYDHVQNVKMVQQEYSPKVIVHESEYDFLKNGFTKLPKGTNPITNFISGMGNRFASWIGEYDPVKADIKIQDDYFINDNTGIKLIETPGHTLGSISIIIDDEVAIVGDTLFGVISNKVLPPFADDKRELIESWKKLLETNCSLFLPGHGKAIKRKLLEHELKKIKK